jgi:tetratricopeptide (TPR) repeat protein
LETVVKSRDKTYYEVLGINKTADSNRIKRAYFNLVRKYQPDRFPEEFKELRAAYETLSDDKKRAEYDNIGALPEAVAPLFRQAQGESRRGRYDIAAEIYGAILKIFPKLTTVKEEYARSFLAQHKPGKAMEVWESLCQEAPENGYYAYECGQCYLNRGWNKKALDMFWCAVELDRGKSKYWEALGHCYMVGKDLNGAIEANRLALEATGDRAAIPLYTAAVLYRSAAGEKNCETYLKKMVRLMREGRAVEPGEKETAFCNVILCSYDLNRVHYYPYLKQMADLLPHVAEEYRDQLDELKCGFEIDGLEARGFSDVFTDLLMMKNVGDTSKEAQRERLAMEYYILKEKDTINPQLQRLKKEYPDLYALHGPFFDEALAGRGRENMMRRRVKELGRYKLTPRGYNEDEEDLPPPTQTVRRETPKVGRNDPCPCGSGKKYKHCCGA